MFSCGVKFPDYLFWSMREEAKMLPHRRLWHLPLKYLTLFCSHCINHFFIKICEHIHDFTFTFHDDMNNEQHILTLELSPVKY